IHLPLVLEVLPMTATGGFVIRTAGLLTVRGRLEDAAYPRSRVIFLLFDDFRFDQIARRSPWHEYDALLRPRESGSAVNQFFYFETHRAHDGNSPPQMRRGGYAIKKTSRSHRTG